MKGGPPGTQEVTMPVFFLLGLTILVLVIAVWATVVEEDEITTMMDESAPEQEPEPYEEPYRYPKAS